MCGTISNDIYATAKLPPDLDLIAPVFSLCCSIDLLSWTWMKSKNCRDIQKHWISACKWITVFKKTFFVSSVWSVAYLNNAINWNNFCNQYAFVKLLFAFFFVKISIWKKKLSVLKNQQSSKQIVTHFGIYEF